MSDDVTPQEILGCLTHAEKVFSDYETLCDRIDTIYSDKDDLQTHLRDAGFTDRKFDLFWSSMEVLKPAIYCRPPRIVVKPRFSNASSTDKVVAELLERNLNSEFERSDIDESLKMARDDLALANRGVLWVSLDDEDGEKVICPDWLDRCDFLHEPARYWCDVSWTARRSWLTIEQMRDRFKETSGDAYLNAFFSRRENENAYRGVGGDEVPEKAAVWEFWDKNRKRVFWVTEGVDEFLDERDPYMDLKGFFPCPKPAYGTLKRRTLIPRPDYVRYEPHLNQINDLTRRIYDLLDQVRMRGLIAAGGDAASAVQTAMADNNSSQILIPVPGASLLGGTGGVASIVQWVPLVEIATAITGLLESRNQLFADFDRLSGISDIMRGETEADETLGAQRLKGQYGSVRVREKTEEMVRLSRDCAAIAGEIICDNFTADRLMEVGQMEIPSRADVDKDIKALEKAAREEMKALADEAEEAAAQVEDPAQAQAMFQQAQQQITAKYEPRFRELQDTVVIEDVMQVIKDRRGRNLIIDIETDSTVMTDEIAEKTSRAEFLGAFTNAAGAIQPLIAMGETGAKLAAGIFKFALQPYNTNRDLEAIIDEFAENAPEMARMMSEQSGDSEALIEANNKLAEAEQMKAQAAMQKVQADAANKQAENQRKFVELQQKADDSERKFRADIEKLRQSAEQNSIKLQEALAKVDNLRADTMKKLVEADVTLSDQQLDEFKSLHEIELAERDQSMRAEGQAFDQQSRAAEQDRTRERDQVEDSFRERGEQRADRQAEQEPKA
jgi:hypothetical protein